MLCLVLALLCVGPGVSAAPATPAAPGTGAAQHPDAAEDRRFALGLALMEAGQPRAAAAVFTDILARRPGLVRVRLELARAFFLSGNDARARREFLSVLSGDLPAPVRANVLRFLRAIDARRGVDWDANLSLVRLGHTRSYDSDTIQFLGVEGRDGKTAPGLRYALGVTVTESIPALSTARTRVLGFGRLAAYGDEGPNTRFDDMTLRGEAGLRLVAPRATLVLAPHLSRRVVANQGFEHRRGLGARLTTRTPAGATMGLTAGWQKIDHLRSDARDGTEATFGLTGTRALSPRSTLGAALHLTDRQADSPIDDYRRMRLTLFGAFDVGQGITLRPQIRLDRRRVYQPSPASADETGVQASLTVESGRIILGNGFTPYVTLLAGRVKSDIAAFSWREKSVAIGVERRF
ncbi:MAG: tetratricopeptide repeat protein [Rhodobacteraceae bacterium]|nr:tetratricopeptide repeat protein [Paracoccaceae bacterium]